jgi:hypothetical protein
MSDSIKTLPEFRVNMEEAISRTSAWRATHASNPSIPLAFTVRHSELLQLLQESPVEIDKPAFRFYLGYRQQKIETLSGLQLITVPCLLMAAVEGFELYEDKSVKNVGTEILSRANGLNAAESEIFDFTYPCPATCQLNSPLMTGLIPDQVG